MGIKRFFATEDNTITNAFKSNLITRASGSNMGASDILEVFSIYAQTSSSAGLSTEESRAIINFNITSSAESSILSQRTAGNIPVSGSVAFYLKLYNAAHGQTLPIDYNIQVAALTKSWGEGYGLDMDEYLDPGTGSGGFGSTWVSSSNTLGQPWDSEGADISTNTNFQYTYAIGENGAKDVLVDISNLVEHWILGTAELEGTNGLIVRISPTSAAESQSFYTKKFFARGSEFFFKRPVIEARWNSAIKDDAGNFCLSSSLAPASDNLNTLYLYNYIKGTKTNIPSVGTSKILLSVYSGSSDNSAPSTTVMALPVGGGVATVGDTNVTGGWVSAGVYSASFAYTSSAVTPFFPVWHSASTQYVTGCAIDVNNCFSGQCSDLYPNYVSKITNLQPAYNKNDKVRFRLYARPKNWSPTIYTVASTAIETSIIEDAYYKILRVADNLDVVPFGTGSEQHTLFSYDTQGNYFDLDMSMLQEDFTYGIKFIFKFDGKYREQKELFKFRVEREEME
jgi:hypothetical protein